MARQDFNLLADDQLRAALYVSAQKLATRLWPKLKAMAPDISDSKRLEFEDACLKALADHHGLSDLFTAAEA